MSDISNQENAIVLAAANRMVELGSLCGQKSADGEESEDDYLEGQKIFKLLKAYRKKDDLETGELNGILYCMRDLSDEDSFPTIQPLVGQAISYYETYPIRIYKDGVLVLETTKINFITDPSTTVNVVANGQQVDVTVIAASPGTIILQDAVWDASSNTLPSGLNVLKGYLYKVSVGGLPFGTSIEAGALVLVLADNPTLITDYRIIP